MNLEQLSARLRDRYAIEHELGRGGMGTVYLARDLKLDRPVALKVLPEEFAAMASLRDRFLRETKTAASFSHPNIVPVYSVEEGDDLLAFAMAYVEGESLADRVKRAGPLTVRDIVRVLQDVGYALAYAHGRGVVHRDIKPDNIMIERATGRALVMDFGIARAVSAPKAGTEGLTRVGEVVGTPEYMSPEQATGDHVDGRSDLYSLGLTAHFAATGRVAISGDATGKLLARQITEPLPPIAAARSDLPAALAAAIDRCCLKEPTARFQSAEELVETLDAAQLAAPEIPLSIRLLAQELGTISLVLIFGAFLEYFIYRALAKAQAESGNGDLQVVVLLLATVLVTRVLQTMREVGRIGAVGFSADDIVAGLRAVVDERATRRRELRADPVVGQARRRTLTTAVAMLAGAILLFRLALVLRFKLPNGNYSMGWAGSIVALSAVIMFGVSWVLLLRSPFRMPIGERLFRWVWLGSIGRLFVRIAGRKAWRGAQVSTVTRPVPKVSPVMPPGSIDARVASLESRVGELEKWKRKSV
jgi:serine/threonine-protein kinase